MSFTPFFYISVPYLCFVLSPYLTVKEREKDQPIEIHIDMRKPIIFKAQQAVMYS